MVSPSPLGTAPGGSQQVGVCKEAARGYTCSNEEVNVLKARLCRLKKPFGAKSSISVILGAEVRRKTASCREHSGVGRRENGDIKRNRPRTTQP